MTWTISNDRRAAACGLACLLAIFGAEARAEATERYPDIRLSYADLALDTSLGRRAFADRVDSTATIHCERYGAQITPYHRRAQPGFCVHAVRGEILRALPRSLRAAYDQGRINRP